jgi:hypothetical protein
MLSRKREYQSIQATAALWHVESKLPEADNSVANAPTRFYGQFADCMEMYADAQTVAEYINAHQRWFCRCAHPMKVEPLGKNGYALTIGRFGSFGYEVEPKVGLELLPPDKGVYRIKSIPVPDYVAPGYEVDFQSALELLKTPTDSSTNSFQTPDGFSGEITKVEWQLQLAVYIHFPKFIQRLPKSMVQTTGDRLLNQIVRQVSRRLTYKVQEDFHKSLGLPFPLTSRRKALLE